MSLFREPDTRHSVFAEAKLAAVESRRSILGIDATTKRLLDEHPDCGISLDELRNYLIRFAVRQQVAIEVG